MDYLFHKYEHVEEETKRGNIILETILDGSSGYSCCLKRWKLHTSVQVEMCPLNFVEAWDYRGEVTHPGNMVSAMKVAVKLDLEA